MTDAPRPGRAAPPRMLTVALSLGGFTSAFVYVTPVPLQALLPELFETTRAETAWVMTAALVTAVIVTPIAGRLGDLYGRRCVLLALIAILITGSVLAAASSSIFMLIAARFLQGCIAGAVPLGVSIINELRTGSQRARDIAIVSSSLGVGAAMGLPASVLLTEGFGWRSAFLAAAAVGAITLLLILWQAPRDTPTTPARFDVLGAIGLTLGISLLMTALAGGPLWGWGSAGFLGLVALGLAVLAPWCWYELRTASPLLDLRLAAKPTTLLTNLACVGSGFALLGSNVTLPQVLELPIGVGMGLEPLPTSFIIMLSGVAQIAVAPFAAAIAERTSPKTVLIAGLLACIAAFGLALIGTQPWHLVIVHILIGMGIGLSYSVTPLLILRHSPLTQGAEVMGINAVFRGIGTAGATAVIGSVLAADIIAVNGVHAPTTRAFATSHLIVIVVLAAATALSLLLPREPKPIRRG